MTAHLWGLHSPGAWASAKGAWASRCRAAPHLRCDSTETPCTTAQPGSHESGQQHVTPQKAKVPLVKQRQPLHT